MEKTQKVIGSLLYLLNKLNAQLDAMEQLPGCRLMLLTKQYIKRRSTVKKVYAQQKKLHETGERSEGMIVSIDKS